MWLRHSGKTASQFPLKIVVPSVQSQFDLRRVIRLEARSGLSTRAASPAKRPLANTSSTQNWADEALKAAHEVSPTASELETLSNLIHALTSLVSSVKYDQDAAKAQITILLTRPLPAIVPLRPQAC